MLIPCRCSSFSSCTSLPLNKFRNLLRLEWAPVYHVKGWGKFKRHYGDFCTGADRRSFPSVHSATSFAFAAVIAQRYPKNKWAKWGAYALATGVSLSRYPAKKHYPSDILIGATLGYVTGTYLAEH